MQYTYYIKYLYLDMFREIIGRPISPLSIGALHGRSQRVTIPDAVEIQFLPPEDEHIIA
jgi:hypothetical protein